MFGQQTQPFGQTTQGLGGFGQSQGASGLFGNTSGSFGGPLGGGAGGGFGTIGQQQQNPQTPIFGGAQSQPSGFGGANTGGGGLFGQTSTQGAFGGGATQGFGAFGSGGNAPVNQGATGGGFSSFSQAAQKSTFGGSGGSFGGQTSQGISGFGGAGGGGGLFGQKAQPTGQFGIGSTTSNQQQQQQQQVQPQNLIADKGFYRQVQAQAQITTWNYQFNAKNEAMQEQSKTGNPPIGLFHNIRVEPQFALQTQQMLKVMDMIMFKSQGQQVQNYEFIAMQEFNQIGAQQYKFYQQLQPPVGGGFGQGGFGQTPGSGGLFGSTSQGFGGAQGAGFGQTQGMRAAGQGFTATTSAFGGGQSAGGFGFGGASSATGGSSLFGATSSQSFQSKPLGAGAGFGQQSTTMGLGGGGLFGQQQQQQQNQLGGGGGLFGKPAAGGGGLFGSQPQQTQPFGGGGASFGQAAAGGGGLFGQTQQQPGGSFFSAQQPQSQPSSLFGQPQQQQPQQQPQSLFGGAQGGSLFGGQQQQQPTSLFGQSQPQQQQQPSSLFGGAQQQPQGALFGDQRQTLGGGQPSSLFGGAAQQQPGGSLFGGLSAGQQKPATSLFGGGQPQQQQQQQQQPGSLFGGGQQQQPGSLFGGSQQQQQPGGGLFGAQQQQQPAQQTGLFGATSLGQGGSLFGKPAGQSSLFQQQPQQQQPSSLFGASAQAGPQPQQQTSLFGGMLQPSQMQQTPQPSSLFTSGQTPQSQLMMQQQQQQQYPNMMLQQQTPQYNPYQQQNLDPFALGNSFLLQESPLGNVEEELKRIKEMALKSQQNNPYKDISLTQTLRMLKQTPSSSSLQSATTIDFTYQPPTPNEEDEYRDKKNKELFDKYIKIFSQEEEYRKEPKQMFTANKGYTTQYQTNLKIGGGRDNHLVQSEYGNSQIRPSGYGSLSMSRESSVKSTAQKMRENQEELRKQRSIIVERDQQEDFNWQQPTQKDVINITVNIPEFKGRKESKLHIKIHVSRDTKDIYDAVDRQLRGNYQFNYDTHSYLILYKNHVLNKNLSLKEAGIQSNCQIHLAFESLITHLQEEEEEEVQKPKEQKLINSFQAAPQPVKELAPKERIPKEPKIGYTTSPSMMDLARMSLDELQSVRDFKIMNDHGSIMFEGETDLTDVDLKRDITIVRGSAEVYNDEDSSTFKPPVGQKLNKPAIITLQGITSKKPTYQEKIEFFKQQAAEQDSEFISYNDSKQELKFKVQHFTKYAFAEDEDSNEQEQKHQEEQMQQIERQSVISEDFQSHQSFTNKDQYPTYTQALKEPQINSTTLIKPSTTINRQLSQRDSQQTYGPLFASSFAPPTLQQPYRATQTQAFTKESLINIADDSATTRRMATQQQPISIRQPSLQDRRQLQDIISEEGSLMMDYEQASESSHSRRRFHLEEQPYLNDAQQIYNGSEAPKVDMVDLTKAKSRGIQRINIDTEESKKVQRQNQMNKDIMESIKIKENAFKQARKIAKGQQRLTAEETMRYLESKGIKVPQSKQLKRPQKIVAFKPQFRSDGSLIQLSKETNKIKVTQIPIESKIKLDEYKKIYGKVTDILVEHGKLTIDQPEPYLGQRFENIRLNDYQNTGNFLVPHSFDDSYFEKLLGDLLLQTLTFKENPTEMFDLLESLAKHLVSSIQSAESSNNKILKDKLQQEFYVICTLNALFCNPCIHLVQIHHKFTGIKNYEKAKGLFAKGGAREFKDGFEFEIQKQRRNALTEVVRFICSQEFPLNQANQAKQTLEQIYTATLHHLNNGDLKSAIEHLTSNGKHKMALHVSQCFTSTSSAQYLQEQFQTNKQGLYQKFHPKVKEVIEFMTGNKDVSQSQPRDWIRLLGYYLLVKIPPNVELTRGLAVYQDEVYKQFERAENNHQYPLIYFLIKLYTAQNHEQLITDYLSSFYRIKPTEKHNVQDYRIQYLTILVFYHLQKHYNRNQHLYANRYANFSIKDQTLSIYAIKYSQQLLRIGDWQQALVIAHTIPQQSSKMKKAFMFDILMKKGLHLVDHAQLQVNRDFIENRLQIPNKVTSAIRGVVYQYRKYYEFAHKEWLAADHLNMYLSNFLGNIVPLYFHLTYNDVNLSHLKSKADLLLKEFFAVQNIGQALLWKQEGNLVNKFLNLLLNEDKKIPNENDLKSLALNLCLKSSLSFILLQSEVNPRIILQSDPVQRLIWEHLLQLDLNLKLSDAQLQIQPPSYNSRLAQSQEPLLDLINLYPDNPLHFRTLDMYAINNLPLMVSKRVQVSQQQQ